MIAYRWILLAGIWLLYFSFGVIVASMAPLIPVIGRELGLDNARMGLILGAWPLAYLIAALPCGILLDRLTPRLSLFLGGLAIALSGIARGLADGETTLFLAVALFGLGGPLISVGAPKLVAQWFEGPNRGMAMGIYMTGPALGTAAALALTVSVILPLAGGDWRSVMWIYGLLALASAVIWFTLASHPDASTETPVSADELNLARGSVKSLFAVPSVRLILGMAVGLFFINHALNNWLPEMLRAGGLDAREAGVWAAIPTLVGIVGSLIVPRLAIRRRRIAILIGLFSLVFVGSLLLASDDATLMLVALILLGITRGAAITVVLLLLLEAPGMRREAHGRASGLFYMAGEVGGVLGPLSVGLLSNSTGTFTSSYVAIALISLVMIALMPLLPRRRDL